MGLLRRLDARTAACALLAGSSSSRPVAAVRGTRAHPDAVVGVLRLFLLLLHLVIATAFLELARRRVVELIAVGLRGFLLFMGWPGGHDLAISDRIHHHDRRRINHSPRLE